MPELPDILLYLHALEPRVVGRRIESIELGSPFLLRSVEPRLEQAAGRTVEGLRRLGKRIAFELDGGLFLVFHLMIAGRFKWSEKPPPAPRWLTSKPAEPSWPISFCAVGRGTPVPSDKAVADNRSPTVLRAAAALWCKCCGPLPTSRSVARTSPASR